MYETTQAIQPLMKLTEANMALVTRFCTSNDVLTESTANMQQMAEQTQKTAMALVQSSAFQQLCQGMWKNYTEFFTQLGHAGMAAMTEGQAELTRQAQETGDAVINIATRNKQPA